MLETTVAFVTSHGMRSLVAYLSILDLVLSAQNNFIRSVSDVYVSTAKRTHITTTVITSKTIVRAHTRTHTYAKITNVPVCRQIVLQTAVFIGTNTAD